MKKLKENLQSSSMHTEFNLNEFVIQGLIGEGGSAKVYKVEYEVANSIDSKKEGWSGVCNESDTQNGYQIVENEECDWSIGKQIIEVYFEKDSF